MPYISLLEGGCWSIWPGRIHKRKAFPVLSESGLHSIFSGWGKLVNFRVFTCKHICCIGRKTVYSKSLCWTVLHSRCV